MANAYQDIDLTTLQPNGKTGEPSPSAWKKAKEMFQDIYLGRTDVANRLHYMDAAGKDAFTAITQAARNLLDDADSAAMLQTLGLGTPSTLGKGILTAADAAAVQTLLRLVFAASGSWYAAAGGPNKIPSVDVNGILDVGKYLDFHESSADTSDFSGRMFSSGGAPYWINPSVDNVARAVFTQLNIVGAVGFANNYPSGAVVERGSNANGVYTRFADGTQICRAVFDQNIAFGNPYASGFYGVFGWDYPAGFKPGNIPSVMYTAKPQGGLCLTAGGIDPGDANVTRYTALPFAFVNQTMPTRISLVAVGEWR